MLAAQTHMGEGEGSGGSQADVLQVNIWVRLILSQIVANLSHGALIPFKTGPFVLKT